MVEVGSLQTKATGFILAAVTIGSLVAIGYAVSRPREKSKRLMSQIDKKLEMLEQRLHLAASVI
ncbi:hypothetical protein BH11ARM1_BH11ARM1_07360 [soil metagenome]